MCEASLNVGVSSQKAATPQRGESLVILFYMVEALLNLVMSPQRETVYIRGNSIAVFIYVLGIDECVCVIPRGSYVSKRKIS